MAASEGDQSPGKHLHKREETANLTLPKRQQEEPEMKENLFASDLAACPAVFDATRDDPAPLFTADAIVNGNIQKVNLADYEGKWVLLFFYPSDFTFV